MSRAVFPRNDAATLSDDGDALHFCSTCAFSQSCLAAGMDKRVLMYPHSFIAVRKATAP